MIKKTTVTYEAAPTAIFPERFSFIFLANILSAAAKNVEVLPPLLHRIATHHAGKSGSHGSLISPLRSFVSTTFQRISASCDRKAAELQSSAESHESCRAKNHARSEERRVGKECRSRWSP